MEMNRTLKKTACNLIAGVCCASGIFAQEIHPGTPDISGRYYQLIEAPASPEKWEAWRQEIRAWRDSALSQMKYRGENYEKPQYQWAASAYSTLFLMANDLHLYDQNGDFDIQSYLKKYEENYGGVDVVVLWPTYPQLGFDNRNQYAFYRNLPGGVAGLKKLCQALHQMGKKLMIAYNPWDNIARMEGKTDEDELLDLLRETGADGVFLDTISNFEGFFQQMQGANPGAVFQSEIPISPAALEQVHQSWLELGWSQQYKNLEFTEVPSVVRNRWLEQRHLIYRLSRFSHEQSILLQNAWINGCGVVIWENVFGTVNELNPRDRSMLQAMLPLLRRYTNFFTAGEWTPLFPVRLNRVYASQWQWASQKLWTLINRQEQWATGKLFEEPYIEGARYFDLVKGEELTTRIENGKVSVYATFRPKAIGCILSIPAEEATEEFFTFLKHMAAIHKKADFSTEYQLPAHTLTPVVPTRKYAPNQLPKGMVQIPVQADSVKMEFRFRQRECGFYPIDGYVDHSYLQILNETAKGSVTVKLSPFAMDESLVTNAQFARFLRETSYQPTRPGNFLKHWINQAPPRGQENHPVVWITLDDARAYARWVGKRLPTEAEWQWAAQNGGSENLYPWGNEYDPARCNGGQTGGTTSVRQFEKGKSLQGLYDMSGNVWQLTESERSDGYNRYCILRGGAWYINPASPWYADQGPQQTRFGAKYLLACPELDRCATVGFRCVADIGQP